MEHLSEFEQILKNHQFEESQPQQPSEAAQSETISMGGAGQTGQQLEGFSLLAAALHTLCFICLYHAHLVSHLCLVSFLGDFRKKMPTLSAILTTRSPKRHLVMSLAFNLGVPALLFALENIWLLPKRDHLRVCLEAIALLLLTFLEHVREQEHFYAMQKARGNKKRRKMLEKAKLKQSRRLSLLLLTLSLYVYIDTTGVSVWPYVQEFFSGLPTPGLRRKKIPTSRVKR